MLSKRARLSREVFARYFASGVRHHTPTLTLIYTPESTLKASVVVSKKVTKLANKRNTLRRRLYGVIELFAKHNDLKGVIIIITKPPFAGLSRQAQSTEAKELLSRLIKPR